MSFWPCSIVFFIVFWTTVLQAQTTRVQLEKTIQLEATAIETDNIGNVYVFNGAVIKKFSLTGDALLKNSILSSGEITSIDASNALKLVVFFKDLSQIQYIDNLLSARGEPVALDMLGYYQTTAICRSYNDGLWLFDQTTFELSRLNEQLEPTAQSGNLAQILGFVPNPTYMREYNNAVYIIDPDQGVLVFDWYGSYQKKIPIPNISSFRISANKLFFMQESVLESYDLQTAAFAKVNISAPDIIDFSIHENTLFLLTKNQLLIYRIIVD